MIEFDWTPSTNDKVAITAEYQANTGARYRVGVVKAYDGYLMEATRPAQVGHRRMIMASGKADTLQKALKRINEAVEADIHNDLHRVDIDETAKDERLQASKEMMRQAQVWRP